MSQLALKIENVSKMYRLGQVGTGSLVHDLNRVWARLTGKEDPLSTVGVINEREEAGGASVWALRHVDFEVEQGEILGIIGRNGAGKSTLLKLLSRVTSPTEGAIKINGRIASLLEVGTGFHPDLTGRENIFLNGAILGMTRREIDQRFDEIVEFSGCAKYIDTPVKRYSSGMYVRLAFAVAAHLETDILILDEVLAVGDAEFQQKCLGKMQDMSRKSHRTVLFVSHNMAAVKRLCTRSLLMEKGTVVMSGPTEAVIERYLTGGAGDDRVLRWPEGESPRNEMICLNFIEITDGMDRNDSILSTDSAIKIVVNYRIYQQIYNFRISATVMNVDGDYVFSTSDFHFQDSTNCRDAGAYKSVCHIPANLLNMGHYSVELAFEIPLESEILGAVDLNFEVSEMGLNQMGPIIAAKPLGVVHPQLQWDVVRLDTDAVSAG